CNTNAPRTTISSMLAVAVVLNFIRLHHTILRIPSNVVVLHRHVDRILAPHTMTHSEHHTAISIVIILKPGMQQIPNATCIRVELLIETWDVRKAWNWKRGGRIYRGLIARKPSSFFFLNTRAIPASEPDQVVSL
ncbi:hypothetical protein PIB30_107048, partial [Stylosanthes scabra]|nr:hypothetical protein [Stylosanthes scabra]